MLIELLILCPLWSLGDNLEWTAIMKRAHNLRGETVGTKTIITCAEAAAVGTNHHKKTENGIILLGRNYYTRNYLPQVTI